jgi:hypothetical protein
MIAASDVAHPRLTVTAVDGSAPSRVLEPVVLNTGFRELGEVELTLESGEGWRLEIDDELVIRQGECRGLWKPSFFAGEVRARLIHHDTDAEQIYRLDVSPDGLKFGADKFKEVVADLWKEEPGLLLGTEPSLMAMGREGSITDPSLDYSRLRQHGLPFVAALARLAANPIRILCAERELMPLSRVRRADTRTALSLLRSPSLVAQLKGQEPAEGGAEPRVDAPIVELTVDNPANRCILALALAVRRRAGDCIVRLACKVQDEKESATRSSLKPRWAVRRAFLEGLLRKVELLIMRPPLRQVRRPEVTAAGLNAVSAHPLYSRCFTLGWKAIRPGFEGEPTDDTFWTSPTWEIYERWCFVALRRLLRHATAGSVERRSPSDSWPITWTAASAALEVTLYLQLRFPAWLPPGTSEFRSISGERCPDIVVTVTRPGVEPRFLVLDAKYRQSRRSVLEAMESAHNYHDALRWAGRMPDRALLLIPSGGAASWLEEPAFQEQHGVGVVVLAPESEPAAWRALAPTLGLSEQ